jgi:phospholipid/cholesterol/gamma-HCH transport system substrate-binding protein
VTTAIRKHLRDFVAIVALFAIAMGILGYILSQQRLRFPLIEDQPFTVWVELSNAQAVTPGQGQTVRVSGMRVGDIGEVKLREGRALVRLDLDKQYEDLVHRDAKALLRPRTGLKDMFLALDPGSPDEPLLREGDTIPIDATAPDVNPDEILSVLDADTRDYLKLLINGAGKGLKGRGGDLRQVFVRLGPLHRDIATLNELVATRRRNLRRLITNYGSTVQRLGREDRALVNLVRNSSEVFDKLANEDTQIAGAIARLPSALRQSERTLIRVNELGATAGPAFEALRPAVRRLPAANAQLRPLAEEIEPVIRTRIRPFVRDARPYVRNLRPAAQNLRRASPDLRESFYEINRLVNMASFNPGGREGLTGSLARDRARQEGLLFWLAWLTHNTNSLFATSDAGGPIRRTVQLGSCTTYGAIAQTSGLATLENILGLQGILNDAKICPAE